MSKPATKGELNIISNIRIRFIRSHKRACTLSDEAVLSIIRELGECGDSPDERDLGYVDEMLAREQGAS